MENINAKRYNFFLKGNNERAVLLIHGITGTPSEMGYLGRSLHKAGCSVLCNTLPRHCDTLKELKKVTWEEIAEACAGDLGLLLKDYQKVFVCGLSMGALMGIHLAAEFPGKVSGIIALAPTVFYDGWALQKEKFLLNIIWQVPFIRKSMVIREGWPHGLKDEQLRENVHRFYKNAKVNEFDSKVFMFGSPFFPVASLYEHQRFAKVVKKELKGVITPIIVMHAKDDDMTSINNAHYILNNIGSLDKSLVVLEDSYHMITIDKEKDKVFRETIGFINRF